MPTLASPKQKNTEELKQYLRETLVEHEGDPLKQKVKQSENELAPIFQELSSRNPLPHPEDQLSAMLGIWTPIWTTMPYQDILPGRVHDQSYQIFHGNGYYANIARYAPGHANLCKKLTSLLIAIDLMVLQKFEVQDNQWMIQNIAVKKTLRCQAQALTPERAEEWFAKVMDQLPDSSSGQNIDQALDKSTTKKLQTAFKAQPEFEHLYIDEDFRLVKTRRDPKQRFSYTIVTRCS